VKQVNLWRHALQRWRASVFALVYLVLLTGWGIAAAAESLTIGGTGTALGTMQLLAREFSALHPECPVTIVHNLGSRGGVKAVLDGSIGLAVVSRALDERERALGAVDLEYARTPFVFAISANSIVTAITTNELADIYAGKMIVWPDGSPIRVVLRPPSDIDTEMVKNISPDMRRSVLAAQARPGVRVAVNDQDAAADLEKIPGAIGPSTLALIVSEKRLLRALILDGKEPTLMNAASGAYPLSKRLFLVTGAKRTAVVAQFVNFVQSPAGRKIIVSNGQFVP
jgi:phosphate transport system substrate-binding protein